MTAELLPLLVLPLVELLLSLLELLLLPPVELVLPLVSLPSLVLLDALELGSEVALDDGVLVWVDASAAEDSLSCHTTTPVTAATATPAAPTAAVTARALRRPLSRTFMGPPLGRIRAGH